MSDEAVAVQVTIRLPRGDAKGPPAKTCRHAVLVVKGGENPGYVIYDRVLSRIIDGVYYGDKEMALRVAALLNTETGLAGYKGRPPNGDALGLLYPRESGGDD